MEVSERLVGSPAFKAGGMGDPCPAGSIPVHLRQDRTRDIGCDCRVRACGRWGRAGGYLCSMTKNRMILAVLLGGLLLVLARKIRDV